MRSFFVRPDRVFDDALFLEGEAYHHIRDVLRLGTGALLRVSDGSGYLYRCRIAGFQDRSVQCRILEREPLPASGTPRVTLLVSIPKGKRLDWLVQKATEVGAHEILPVIMGRSVRTVRPERAAIRTERLRRIAEAAAGQCGRPDLPHIGDPMPYLEAAERVGTFALRIFFEPERGEPSLRRLRESHPEAERIALLVGPEGGISEPEAATLREKGFVSASLGDRILRVETAGILAVALVRYEWGTASGRGRRSA